MKNKYNAVKYINEDGIQFDSKKEAKRYAQLKNDESVKSLRRQVKFELQEKFQNGKNENIRSINYIADFVYLKDDQIIVEDAKGLQTEVFKLKRKLFEKKYYPLVISIV